MATNGNRRLPSDTIGRYHFLPMVTDGRTPNAPYDFEVSVANDVAIDVARFALPGKVMQ